MKKIFSNFYHKFLKYKFHESHESIDYKEICDPHLVESEKYRFSLFNGIDLKKIITVLDYGCGYGVNMNILKKLKKEIKLNCMEISKERLTMLDIINDNVYKMGFNKLAINNLPKLEKHFDLAYCDAVLIYVRPQKIHELLKSLIKSSKQTILLHELTYEFTKEKIDHLHIHNYRAIIKKINPSLKVKFFKSLRPGAPWSTHGTKIIINRSDN